MNDFELTVPDLYRKQMDCSLDNIMIEAPYKDAYRRTIEIPQRAHIFKVNCCLKVHNVHLKLASPISG